MKNELRASLFAAVCLLMTMCSSGTSAPTLEAGMTRQEVEKLWGPASQKARREKGGELWYYNFPTTHSVTETYQTSTPAMGTPGGPALMGLKEQSYTSGVAKISHTEDTLKPIGFNASGRLVDLQHGKPALR